MLYYMRVSVLYVGMSVLWGYHYGMADEYCMRSEYLCMFMNEGKGEWPFLI